MSALWTSDDAARATGGKAVGTWLATGISIDTRTLVPGDLFVPLKDIRDGHGFIPMALEKGASAVLSERDISDVPALIVDNTLAALEDLGKAALARSSAKRIAITGSVGKTTVKEMLATALRASGKVHASEKSYNNHWGVPLTMAKTPKNTDFCVFEMGMNHSGELSHLTKLVCPDIAAVTKVSTAHLEFFNSLQDIAKAKAEIFEGLNGRGIGVFNAQSKFKDIFQSKIKGTFATFGMPPADCAIISAEKTNAGTAAQFAVDEENINVDISFHGDHWVENTACVLSICDCLGVDLAGAARALEGLVPIAGRGARHSLSIDGKLITLIDESYNANPESMRSAIAALSIAPGRKIAVLGDMRELGLQEADLHAGLKTSLDAAGIDLVLTCGPRMRVLDEVLDANMRGPWARSSQEAEQALCSVLADGDTVMVKGSNASGMGTLVATLLKNNKNKEIAHVL